MADDDTRLPPRARPQGPRITDMAAGAALLGLTLMVGCPPDLIQPAYGVPVDDDDSAQVDDDDSAIFDDDDADQPLYGVPG